jgi:hypothetical protein
MLARCRGCSPLKSCRFSWSGLARAICEMGHYLHDYDVRCGVNNGPDGPETPIPVYPGQRTSPIRLAMSVSCQFQTHASQQAAPLRRYSITTSARPSSVGGIVRPIDFAVLTLITNSNVVGCSIGISLGFAPATILLT